MLERVWRKGKPPTLLVGMETGTAALENSVCVCGTSLQPCLTRGTLWTVARQAPLSMGFSRQAYWGGLPHPPPGDLPNPGIESASLMSPALAGGLFTTSATKETHHLSLDYCKRKTKLLHHPNCVPKHSVDVCLVLFRPFTDF